MRSRRGHLASVAAVAVGLVLLPACTGGDPGDDASPTATTPAATPSASYQKGERRPASLTGELCKSVSERTLRRFGLKAPEIRYEDTGAVGRCRWIEERSGVARDLAVEFQAYAPVETRRDYTASDEAEHRFGRVRDDEYVSRASRVRGLGDEAKLWRSPRDGYVRLAVRHRNVVLDVHVETTAYDPETSGKRPPYPLLERTVLSAVRETLGRVKGEPVPAPSPTRERGDGEVTEVRDVCGDLPSAGRLVGGSRRYDTSSRSSARVGGCAWVGGQRDPVLGQRGPVLEVQVEAIPPSALDGASGTRVAMQALDALDTKRLGSGRLGDEAKIDQSSVDRLRSRSVSLYVREGNLLVSVRLERWGDPSKQRLRRDAVGVAEDVLAGYR